MTILINQPNLVQETVKYDLQSASEVFVGQDFLIITLGKNVRYLLIIHMKLKKKNNFSLNNFSSS